MSEYNSLEEQYSLIADAIKNADIPSLLEDGIFDFASTIILKDPVSGVRTAADALATIKTFPNVLFWEKTRRFLSGSFNGYADQIKFAEKFNSDNYKYKDFVKTQLSIINTIETDKKIDYFAQLTRCFYLSSMDVPLYFRLVKFIQNCTTNELEFMEEAKYNQHFTNNAMISMLILQGLVVQDNNGEKTYYVISSLGKVLKECSLNFGESGTIKTNLKYYDVEGLPQIEKRKVDMAAEGIMDLDIEKDSELIETFRRYGWDDVIKE